MTSMAATLAASLARLPVATLPQPASIPNGPRSIKVPQRMEGVVDVEGAKEVESINLNSLVRRTFLQQACLLLHGSLELISAIRCF